MRIAFAGLSHWHLGLYLKAARFTGARISGAWDADPLASQRFSDATGITASASLAALLDQKPDLTVVMGRPDAISTALPTILESGLPIILEKPAVRATDELTPLVERVRHDGLF